ncbi:glycosyltransferase family 4 protein [Dactylosporangium sp. CA-139114]|uniref:glycosyltransferase family 4 protein n=1 Tax=Dactylosporangium sp. CA-139114 TaxID=3239931 RepID=UPI003D96A633
MHILLVSHSSDLMGAELSVLPVVSEAVGNRGHRVTVTVPGEGPLTPRLAAAGADVEVLPTKLWMGRRFNPVVGSVRLLQAALSAPGYERYVSRLRPDLVVTNSAVIPAGAVAARRAGIPHVWVVHETLLTNPSLRSALPKRTLTRMIDDLSASIVAVSDLVAEQVLSLTPGAAAKMTVIPPAIPARPLAPPPPAERAGLTRLLLLGRLSEEKGQRDAVEALAICARAGHELHLRFAGISDPAAQETLRALARTLGVGDLIDILGWTDSADALYAWTDATLMLSRNEAFGRVTVESLMSGRPVVGYRAGTTPQLLADGGGLLVEPGVESLARALSDLAAAPPAFARLRAEAVERARHLNGAPSSEKRLVDHLETVRAEG